MYKTLTRFTASNSPSTCRSLGGVMIITLTVLHTFGHCSTQLIYYKETKTITSQLKNGLSLGFICNLIKLHSEHTFMGGQFWAKQLTLSQPGGHHSTTNPPGFSDLATAQCAVRIRRQKNDVAIFSLSLLLQCTVSPFYFLRHFELTRITAYSWTFPK